MEQWACEGKTDPILVHEKHASGVASATAKTFTVVAVRGDLVSSLPLLGAHRGAAAAEERNTPLP